MSGCEAINKNTFSYQVSIDGARTPWQAHGFAIRYLNAYSDTTICVRARNERYGIGDWKTLTLRTISTGANFEVFINN